MTDRPVEREWDTEAIGALIDPLSEHYGTSTDVKRVVSDAGLDLLKPYVKEDKALSIWFEILIVARVSPGFVEKIIQVAAEDYPHDERLVLARKAVATPTAADAWRTLLARLTPQPVDDTGDGPLVNRKEIMARLSSELEQVNARPRGKTLLLLGDSGVGKTRLADCAVCAAREQEMLVLQAQCVGHGAEPLLPLRDALKFHRGRPALQELLDELTAELQDYAPFLSSFLGLDDGAAAEPRRGGSKSEDVYEGLATVLLALASLRGLCLVVDDLTDADDDTLHFLSYLHKKAVASRILTVSTVKRDLVERRLSDVMDRWIGDRCRLSEVPPLEPGDATALVSLRWRGSPLPDEQVAEIVAVTGGNPFFIEQYLEMRSENGSTSGEVPDSVDRVLQRRVRRLDDDTRAFLDAASVALEASNQLDLVNYVADVDGRKAPRLLRRVVEARCLTEDAAGGVSFVQELLRRVVYKELGAQKRLLHRRAAEFLEREGLLASAALHYDRAGRKRDLVRTALEGAASAERGGVYRTALQLYERAFPYGNRDKIGPRLAKAYIVVGQWREANELLNRLPADAVEVRLARAELFAVQGDFNRALKEMKAVLETPSAKLRTLPSAKVETLKRLADINLYLGELETASKYATDALAKAKDANTIAQCRGGIAAAAFYAGRIDEGERVFVEALAVLSSQPVEERDQSVYTTILANVGYAAEVRGKWDEAKRFHEESLAKRREVSDARGILQSLHALARTELGLGSDDAAVVSYLEEGGELASSLGAELEKGKIAHTYADLELRREQPASAVPRAKTALQKFRQAGTAYDTTHAQFTLARAFAANGEQRRAVKEGANARVQLERKGFGLLSRLFPDLAFSYAERTAGGLLGYAYGDAVGLPWEGKPQGEIVAAKVASLPKPSDWPRGSTSDDTALTILVGEHLVDSGGPDAAGFLALLAARAPSIQGLGPSTTQAVEHFRRTGKPPTGDGNTNGALMRSLPIGWALPLDRAADRRAWTLKLARATHEGAEACCAALVGAACAAWAIEGASPELLLDVAREEATVARKASGGDGRIDDMLSALAAGRWQPAEHVDLDPYETLTRVLWCAVNEPSLRDALLRAVRIGGDTDTVAALAGGLLGCRLTPAQVQEQVPWSADVQAPEDALLTRLAVGIAALRTGRASG